MPISSAHILIIHPENNTEELSRNKLRSIFAMRTHQWSDGTPLHVFVLVDNASTHISFCKQVLGMFPYQLRRIWDRQVFSGTGTAPIMVNSEQEMLEKVARTKGGIGYVLPENINSSVKVLGQSL